MKSLTFYKEILPVLFTSNTEWIEIAKGIGITEIYAPKYSSLSPFISRVNPFKLPYFVDMIEVIETSYDADFYGFMNSDILISQRVIDVLRYVLENRKDLKLKEEVCCHERAYHQDFHCWSKNQCLLSIELRDSNHKRGI